jgi:hypothetical protein
MLSNGIERHEITFFSWEDPFQPKFFRLGLRTGRRWCWPIDTVDRAAQRTAALHPGMASISTSSTVQPVAETQDGMTSGIGGSCTQAIGLHQRIELHRGNLSWAHTSAVDNESDGAHVTGTPTNVATTVEPAPGLSSAADHPAVSTDPAALDPHVARNASPNTCWAASLAPRSPELSPTTAHATTASTHAHAVAHVSERASDAECGQLNAHVVAMSSRVYPVSSDGSCPYCGSWNVQHLISPHALQQWKQAEAMPGGAAAVAACATALASAWEITSVEDGATSADQAGEAAAVVGDAASTAGEVGGWQPLSTVTTSTLLSDTPSVDSTDGGVSGVGVDCADEDAGLPWVVLRLLELRRAVKVTASSECPEPSSFRCIDCSYVAPTALHMWTRVRSCPLLLFFVLKNN